ncbi:MAG TPA: YetF domain-containing protein [Parafilimonas sp.]|nr:YetF domain-containing protein [Parafilimonas sp.]
MNTINYLFGQGSNLNMLQMSMRAFAMFFIMLVMIRFTGRRAFAKKSSFDNIVVIMLGAVLARGVVGANAFFSTVAASIVIVALHRLTSWLSVKNGFIEKCVKGGAILLFSNDELVDNNLAKTGISKNDLHESLRLETKKNTLDDIDTAYLETNGRISFILKQKETKLQ